MLARSILVFLILCTACGSALAENVLVNAANGEQGHAWLFGSAQTGSKKILCWVVTPAHVIQSHTGELLPFEILDRQGKRRAVGTPIDLGDIPLALEALGGVSDIAFSRVLTGKGNCTSRLGLPTFTYDLLMKTSLNATATNLFSTSFGFFEMKLSKAGIGSRRFLMEMRAERKEDAARYLKGGISGSTLEISRKDQMAPLSMILQVDPKLLTARAVRFDAIRNAFAHTKNYFETETKSKKAKMEGIPWQIKSYSALSIQGSPEIIFSGNGSDCWAFAALGGNKVANLVLEVSDDLPRTSSIVIEPCAEHAIPTVTIDLKLPSSKFWNRKKTCVYSIEKSNACRLKFKNPRDVRLSFPKGKHYISKIIIR